MIQKNICSKVGVVFGVVHLLIVLIVYSRHFEGSWGGFIIFLLDFPVSLLSFPFGRWVNQWFIFIVFGTVWWYWIGKKMEIFNRHRKHGDEERSN